MSYDRTKIAYVDIETTGLHPDYCEVWEIAVILGEGPEYVWQNRVSRGAQIDWWVRENTRFNTDYSAEKALDPDQTSKRLEELLTGRHMVGACPWFDSERLSKIWRNYSISALNTLEGHNTPWHYHLIDIESAMFGYMADKNDAYDKAFPVSLPWKSDALTEQVGAPEHVGIKHTALDDARWAKSTFEYLFGKGE